MTEAYDSYEKELLQFFQNARDDIAAGGNGIKDIFASIDEILGYMDFEIRSQSAAKKKELQDRTVEHKSTYRKLQTEANRSKADGNKAALLGGKSEEARQRVLNLHDKLEYQNETIASVTRTVNETVGVGEDITKELKINREKIESARGKTQEVQNMMSQTKKQVERMERRDKCTLS